MYAGETSCVVDVPILGKIEFGPRSGGGQLYCRLVELLHSYLVLTILPNGTPLRTLIASFKAFSRSWKRIVPMFAYLVQLLDSQLPSTCSVLTALMQDRNWVTGERNHNKNKNTVCVVLPLAQVSPSLLVCCHWNTWITSATDWQLGLFFWRKVVFEPLEHPTVVELTELILSIRNRSDESLEDISLANQALDMIGALVGTNTRSFFVAPHTQLPLQ